MIRRETRRFSAALRGIWLCLYTERHMRFHTAAAILTLSASVFFDWTPLHYAALFLTIALVVAAEMFNTAAEHMADRQTAGFSATAGRIKDIAAGAVLVSAIAAIGVGICLYAQADGLARLIRFLAHPLYGSLAGIGAVVLVLFVTPGPAVFVRKARRRKTERIKIRPGKE